MSVLLFWRPVPLIFTETPSETLSFSPTVFDSISGQILSESPSTTFLFDASSLDQAVSLDMPPATIVLAVDVIQALAESGTSTFTLASSEVDSAIFDEKFTSSSDDFNRANSNDLGLLWVENESNAQAISILSNNVRLRGNVSGTRVYGYAYWDMDVGPDHFSQLTGVSFPDTPGPRSGLALRLDPASTADVATCYFIAYRMQDTGVGQLSVRILRNQTIDTQLVGGAGNQVLAAYDRTLVAGDVVRGEVEGDVIRVLLNNVAVMRVVDDRIKNGRYGIIASGTDNNDGNQTWDDWTGGRLPPTLQIAPDRINIPEDLTVPSALAPSVNDIAVNVSGLTETVVFPVSQTDELTAGGQVFTEDLTITISAIASEVDAAVFADEDSAIGSIISTILDPLLADSPISTSLGGVPTTIDSAIFVDFDSADAVFASIITDFGALTESLSQSILASVSLVDSATFSDSEVISLEFVFTEIDFSVFADEDSLSVIFDSTQLDALTRVISEAVDAAFAFVLTEADIALFDSKETQTAILASESADLQQALEENQATLGNIPLTVDVGVFVDSRSQTIILDPTQADTVAQVLTETVDASFSLAVTESDTGVFDDKQSQTGVIASQTADLQASIEDGQASLTGSPLTTDAVIFVDEDSAIGTVQTAIADGLLLPESFTVSLASVLSISDIGLFTDEQSITGILTSAETDSFTTFNDLSVTLIAPASLVDLAIFDAKESLILALVVTEANNGALVDAPSEAVLFVFTESDFANLFDVDSLTIVFDPTQADSLVGVLNETPSTTFSALVVETNIGVFVEDVSATLPFAITSDDAAFVLDGTNDQLIAVDKRDVTKVLLPTQTDEFISGEQVFTETLTVSIVLPAAETEVLVLPEDLTAVSSFAHIETDFALFDDKRTQTSVVASELADLQVGIEDNQASLSGSPLTTDIAVFVDANSASLANLPTTTDVAVLPEGVSVIEALSFTLTDPQTSVDEQTIIAISTPSISDVGAFVDSQSQTIVFDPTETDSVSGVLNETPSVTLVVSSTEANVGVFDDKQSQTSTLASEPKDLQTSVEDNGASLSASPLTVDAAVLPESLSVLASSAVTEADTQNSIDDQTAIVVSTSSLVDFGAFIDSQSQTVVFDPTQTDSITGVATETPSETLVVIPTVLDILVGVDAPAVETVFASTDSDVAAFDNQESSTTVLAATEADLRTGVESGEATMSNASLTVDVAIFEDKQFQTSVLVTEPRDLQSSVEDDSTALSTSPLTVDTAVLPEALAILASALITEADAQTSLDEQTVMVPLSSATVDAGAFVDTQSRTIVFDPTETDSVAGVINETPTTFFAFLSAGTDAATLLDDQTGIVGAAPTTADALVGTENVSESEVFASAVAEGIVRTDIPTISVPFVLTESDAAIWSDIDDLLLSAALTIADGQAGVENPEAGAGNLATLLDKGVFVDVDALTAILFPSQTDDLVKPITEESPSVLTTLFGSLVDPGLFVDDPQAATAADSLVGDAVSGFQTTDAPLALVAAVTDDFIPFGGGISGIEVIVSARSRTAKTTSRPKSSVSGRRFKSSPPDKGLL